MPMQTTSMVNQIYVEVMFITYYQGCMMLISLS